jgi:predicted AlkP superfamily pyrophosphatase or phosphodiesterase
LKTSPAPRPAVALLALLLLAGFLPRLRAATGGDTPALLLISMDGFRWDYCARHPAESPHIRELASEGISARELIPVYPSNTFPNHYAIVTGLYPAHHGIVNNDMFDPALGAFFHYTLPAASGDSRWWGGEPIWITAVKQGRTSASYYWVGAEAAVEGLRPTYYKHFNAKTYETEPFQARIDQVVAWLKLPPGQRPAIITFYLEETNGAGHKYGPDSPELAATIKLQDGRIGDLLDRLKAERLPPINVVIVSDHGMTDVSPDRVMLLDDYLDPASVEIDFQSPAMGLRPVKGHGSARDIVRALAGLPHAKAYLTDNRPPIPGLAGWWHRLDVSLFHRAAYLPARFHLTGNPRIPDVWIVPELGWHIQTRANAKVPAVHDQKGDHGFDNACQDMHGILIANGPSFRSDGTVIDPVANIHIYNLLCAALHLTPAPNDGDDRLVRAMLR